MKFYYKDLELEIPANIYYPREDSMLMLDILEKTDLRGLKVLDMGTGSGILAVAAAKKGALVLAVDIDKNAVEIAWKNAAANNTVIRYRCSDLFEKISERFDLIIFNAP